MTVHEQNRELVARISDAMYNFEPEPVRAALQGTFAHDAEVRLGHPFEDLGNADGWYDQALGPLRDAFGDLERRDFIRMAGSSVDGSGDWVGCGGYYTGTFSAPFLGIPPTGQQAAMRYHEYYRVVDGRIVELQGIWDLPELMMQAWVWPMGPSLGRDWPAFAPATSDGLRTGTRDDAASEASLSHVTSMLTDMGKHPSEPVDAMRLPHWWHPRFSWYGPAGIGTCRGIDGFRRWHQRPFLAAMPDRRGGYKGNDGVFFADGNYVAVTGWPGMQATISGDGWLGIAPADTAITMRSLDFWRIEHDADLGRPLIRENWVLVDLLHVWHQIGVDVLARMRELASARPR